MGNLTSDVKIDGFPLSSMSSSSSLVVTLPAEIIISKVSDDYPAIN